MVVFLLFFVPLNDVVLKVLFVRGIRTWSRYESPMFGFIAVKNMNCAEIGRIFHMTGHMLCLPHHKLASISPVSPSHIHVNNNYLLSQITPANTVTCPICVTAESRSHAARRQAEIPTRMKHIAF